MDITIETLGDLTPAMAVASLEEDSIKQALLTHSQFVAILDYFYQQLGTAKDSEGQQDVIEGFCALCFAMGWYSRSLGRQEPRQNALQS